MTNEFSQALEAARRRLRARFALGAGVAALAAVMVLLWVLYSSGTGLRIEPADAGFAGAISHVVYGFSGNPVITVSAHGFRPETLRLRPEEKGGTVLVRLQELPAQLTVRTQPEDEKARWTINGRPQGIGARLQQPLLAGDYEIEADSPHFEIATETVRLERATEKEVVIELIPVDGGFDVASRPPGAGVRIDGEERGETPLSVALTGGRHAVEIVHEEYQTVSETIEITNTERTVVRDYRLSRKTATLAFELRPGGGKLLLNGTLIDGKSRPSVPAGVTNTVTYSRPGYYGETKTVSLAPGESRTLAFRLKAETGKVDIRSEPSATVFVNGTTVGETPRVIDLPSVSHTIRLTRDGFRPYEQKVTPSSKRVTTVCAELIFERAARLAEAPERYTNSIGADFLLFEPTAFEMGAPRHEKGQRANEFQRRIRLTRPFYAATREVTNEQYRAFQPAGARKGDARHPVSSVTWSEAARFCNWLSRREGLKPFYRFDGDKMKGIDQRADGYRLLTEAEWEWLARRANRPSQTVFPWGNDAVVPPSAGNIADETARGIVPFYVPNYTDGYAELAPVGSFAVERSGLFDLTGNVSEWVHDFYSLQPPLSNRIEVDPLGPPYGGSHVVKGSSWRSGTRSKLRAAYRDGLSNSRDDVGFRIGRYL